MCYFLFKEFNSVKIIYLHGVFIIHVSLSFIIWDYKHNRASLVTQTVKSLSTMQETQV